MTQISQVVTPVGGGGQPPMAPLAALPVQSCPNQAQPLSNPLASPVIARGLGLRVPAERTGTQAMGPIPRFSSGD